MKNKFMSLLSFCKAFELEKKERSTEQTLIKSFWRDTGLTYYLIDTLKLSVETEDGVVSFERISANRLEAIVSGISNGSLPHICPKVTAGQTAAIIISLCGATWQELDSKRRVKAIPEAAVLRIRVGDGEGSQAIFKTESHNLRSDVDTGLPTRAMNHAHSYLDISFRQFLEQLEYANSCLPTGFKRGLHINVNNFRELFTKSESSSLSSLSTSFSSC